MAPPLVSPRLQGTLTAVAVLAILVQCILRSPYLLHKVDVLFLDSFQDTVEHLRTNVYLQGNYAPVSEEHIHVPVEGALPRDLNGLFVRNGPNDARPTQKRHHLFDGDGMLHTLRIAEGKATYNNQFIPTPRYQIEQRYGSELFLRLGELTGISGLLKILFVSPNMLKSTGLTGLTSGTANTHTLMYHNRFYACYETSLPFELELDDRGAIRGAVGHETFGGTLDYPVSAHPKVDPRTGSILFHSYTSDPVMVERDGPLKVGEYHGPSQDFGVYQGLPMNHTSFTHDMAFTENYIVVYDGSVHFDKQKVVQFGAPVFDWKESHTMRIGLVSRGDGHTEWIDTGRPLTIVHTLTAWEEEDGTVVLWAPVGDKVDLGLVNDDKNVFHMTEFRISPNTGAVEMTTASTAHNIEFPRVRDDCLGRPCRYGYAGWMTKTTAAALFQGWVSFDLNTKQVHQSVEYGEGINGGEPVVIPKPNSSESNQVYIGSFVHDDSDDNDYFLLYDGETTDLVSRLKMPYRVPFGFHGQWIDGDALEAHVAYHRTKAQ